MIEHFKKLGKHTLVYGFASVIPALVGLILVPILTRTFSPSDYGVIELVLLIISVLVSFLILGFDSAIAFYFYKIEDEIERKKIISTGFYFLLIISLVIIIGLIFFVDSVSLVIFKETKYSPVLFIAFLVAFFTLLNSFFGKLMRIYLKPYNYSYLIISTSFLSFLFILFFVLKTNLGIIGIFYGYLIANTLSLFLGFGLTFSSYTLSFSRSILKSLLTFGLPLALVSVFGLILTLADRFFLANIMTLREVGIYSVGVKISHILLLVVGGFQLAWGPFAFSIYKKEKANQTFAKTLKYFTIITCGLALIITIFSREIVTIIADSEYINASNVVGLLSLAIIACGSYYIVSLGVSFTQKTYHIAWTSGLAVILNITLNLILIPKLGMIGAGITTLLSYCVSAYLLYRVSQYYYPIPFKVREVGFIWIITIILMICGSSFDFNNLVINTIIKIFILAVFIVSILYSKILRKDELATCFYIMKEASNKYLLKK